MRTHLISWLVLLVLGAALAVVSLIWITGTWEWVLFGVGVAAAVIALIGLVEHEMTAGRPIGDGHSDPTIGGLR